MVKEKITTIKAVAMVLALTGLGFYSGALLDGSQGIIFGILSGLTAGISALLYKLLGGIDRGAILRVQYGVGAAFAVLLTWFSGEQIKPHID